MEKALDGLTSALALEPREHLALVGGGGKTSLMFSLAGLLHRKGKRVVTSTTTKIRHSEALSSPRVIFVQSDSSWKDKLMEGLENQGLVFLAKRLLDSGKVEGIDPSLADELYGDRRIDYLIVEADGSAGHPVKAPDAHEPVIPASATAVVAMLGLEAVGRRMGPEVVFRGDLFRKLTGINPGERLTAPALSRLFLAPDGLFKGTPLSARRIVFLNKLDLVSEEGEARELGHSIIGSASKQIDRVVIGSVAKGRFEILGCVGGLGLRPP